MDAIIQNRRGDYSDVIPENLRPGEYVIVQQNDPNSDSGQSVYVGIKSGVVKRLAFSSEVGDYHIQAQQAAQQAQQAQAQTATIAGQVNTKATQVATDAQAASDSATAAQTAAQTATTKASEAAQSKTDAQTASQTAVDVLDSMAPAYSASSTYAVGDLVIHDNQLYECTTAITTAEAWNSNHWRESTVENQLTDLKEDLNYSKSVTPGYVLSATNNGHGSQWVPYSGAPTDEQVAEAVSDWLDEHPEATTTVEDGSITEPKLALDVLEMISKSGSIVNVQSYGAKGDDFTDDTAAIQRCIDENPHTIIVFPKGIYRISSKLNCYTRVGGTYLFLGGSTIKAIASMETMLDFYDYQTEYKGTEGAPFGILGGRLDGYKYADACIRNSGVAIKVDNVYMMSFNVCGVHDTGILSNYSKIKCDKARTDEAWSEGTTAGIIADCGDSFFTDVQIQGCHYGVLLRKGGCFFNGCYFFSATNYHLHPTAPMDGYGVYIEGDMAIAPRTTFNGCYFDSNIYAIYSVASKVWNISLIGCKFFTTDASYFTATKVYLIGGTTNINIRATGIECHSTPTCDMLLGRQSFSETNNRNFSIKQNKPNTYIHNILNINNLDEAFYNIAAMQKDTVILIGAISNANLKNGVYKLNVTYGTNSAEYIIKNIADVFSIVDAKRNFTRDYFEIIIDQTPQSGDALESVTYYPIYLKSNMNGFNGHFNIRLKPISFKPACCYFYNDTYRTGSYTINSPFTIKTYTGSNSGYYLVSDLNVDDVIKIGNIHSSNTTNATMRLKIGTGGSYSEFVFRKVGDAYNLLDATRLSSRNWFNVVIDQTPVVNGTDKDYAVYIDCRTTNFSGNILVQFEALTPGIKGYLYKETYEEGSFTVNSPFTLTMYENT